MSNNRSKGAAENSDETKPIALVYRGPAADCNGDGCSEALAVLLESAEQWNFDVRYVGPEDEGEMSVKDGLQLPGAILYAQPGGGGDEYDAFVDHLEECAQDVRNFVNDGGRYFATCMGAYFAGNSDRFPGFDLGLEVGRYIETPNPTVKNTCDTVIQVSWNKQTGQQAGQTITRWMYFQDGPCFEYDSSIDGQIILAKYMTDDNMTDDNMTDDYIAAMVKPYGKGWIGVCGPHPEADASWYNEFHLCDPDGLDADLGIDLINTLMMQKKRS